MTTRGQADVVRGVSTLGTGENPTVEALADMADLDTDLIPELDVNPPSNLTAKERRNYYYKILGDKLFYRQITLGDLRKVLRDQRRLKNVSGINKSHLLDAVDKLLDINNPLYGGRTDIYQKYEKRDLEEGAQRMERQRAWEEEVEIKNRSAILTADKRTESRLQAYEKGQVSVDTQLNQYKKRFKLNDKQAFEYFILTDIFPVVNQVEARAIVEDTLPRLPKVWEQLFNAVYSSLTAILKNDPKSLGTQLKSIFEKGELSSGLNADTKGLFDTEDLNTLISGLGFAVVGDLKNGRLYWMRFILDKIRKNVNLEEFKKELGDTQVRAIKPAIPFILAGKASIGSIKRGVKTATEAYVGEKQGEQAGRVAGRFAESFAQGASEAAIRAAIDRLPEGLSQEELNERIRDISQEETARQLREERARRRRL